jgi:archaellum component FlaC
MDTRLDLFDLLQDSKPDVVDITSFDIGSNAALTPVSDVVPVTEVEPTSIEDLFNQMSRSFEPVDNVAQAAADEQELLSEVLTKLTRYVEQEDSAPIIPDLGNGVLSPVSVSDIESLLSDNFMEITPNDSGLESLLSSRPDSPTVQYDVDPEYVPPESSSGRKKKKGARSTPYGKLPRDRKERKKIQNKTAALKYRQKKKDETEQVTTDVEQLESRNTELKDKVESMTREIQYLKDLMAEVLKAKSITV